ncbi:hypothetical protein ABZ470_32370 [Streptosporangium sp. NPDC020072]|uniref:hypothetical protein n=1 Tax=Streptosporangium sp. NPDC020072 TaxID=3154788 RepID=UPI0034496A0B
MTAAHRPDRALKASRAVNPQGLFKVQYGRHLLDVSRAFLERRRTDEAEEAAARALDLSAEWFRHQAVAETLVHDLVERKTRLNARLRILLQGVEHN